MFKLPDEWYIKVPANSEKVPEIKYWREIIIECGPWTKEGILDNYGTWYDTFYGPLTEISLSEFRKFVYKLPTTETTFNIY